VYDESSWLSLFMMKQLHAVLTPLPKICEDNISEGA
jgi:hypothetical protein